MLRLFYGSRELLLKEERTYYKYYFLHSHEMDFIVANRLKGQTKTQ